MAGESAFERRSWRMGSESVVEFQAGDFGNSDGSDQDGDLAAFVEHLLTAGGQVFARDVHPHYAALLFSSPDGDVMGLVLWRTIDGWAILRTLQAPETVELPDHVDGDLRLDVSWLWKPPSRRRITARLV